VPPRGYAWWYVDALSDDGHHGLTLIAFIGSVFSPYYFKGRRRGRDNPRDYCSLNVCLYGDERRWTMTERRERALVQREDALTIGPSACRWNADQTFTVEIDEVCTPIPRGVRGRVHVMPSYINDRVFELDGRGRHRWRPIAPSARVEVVLERPALRWVGHAYLDRNWGDEPLEDAFVYWDWSRASLGGDESLILYHADRRDGGPLSLGLHFGGDGSLSEFEAPPNHRLPRTPIWRMPRYSQADAGNPPRVVKTLEDTPFYSRSVIGSHLLGRPIEAVHESLSLDRFRSGWVQHLLPYRMPRR
jgi:carotenoid 1,2-hydratase